MIKLSKKHKIIITIGIILTAIIMFLIYYLFLPKKYTFYIDENIGNVSAVRIDCDEYNKGGIYVYDKELIDELYKALEDVKVAPYYSLKMADDKKNFWVDFIGENQSEMGMYAIYDESINIYEVSMSVKKNGKKVEHPVWDFVGRFTMDKETGDKIHELVSKSYVEYMRDITVEDILELSKNKDTDLYKFFQFQYEEMDEMGEMEVENGLTASPIKLMIEGKKGYIIVWYVHTIIIGDSTETYIYVEQAKIYNENGEEMDFYDEGIEEFLEAME